MLALRAWPAQAALSVTCQASSTPIEGATPHADRADDLRDDQHGHRAPLDGLHRAGRSDRGLLGRYRARPEGVAEWTVGWPAAAPSGGDPSYTAADV